MIEPRPNGNERPTIHAVATRAGVSPTTASLVLAGKGGKRRISESTHRRVIRAAEELNYAPNLGTRTIRGARTNILSFFSTYRNRDRNDLYMNTLSSAIEAAGGAVGYDILVHCNYDRDVKQIYQFLNGGLADGLLIVAPREEDPLLHLLRKSRLPVVVINGIDPIRQYSSVSDDVRQGVRIVAEELVGHGHRDIAILADENPEMQDCAYRISLLREFLGRQGVEVREDRLLGVNEKTTGAALDRLLEGADRPTAVFCWHDRIAYSFLTACEERGLSIPDQMSVVGYDGLHWPSRSSHMVASVKVDLDNLAAAAVRRLHEVIVNPELPVVREEQPVFFLRGTTLGAAPLQRCKTI